MTVIPNASPFWPGCVEYGNDYSLVQDCALKQIAAGLNTYTTAGSWSTVIREYEDEEDAKTCLYFKNLLQMQTDADVLDAYEAKFGTRPAKIPITLQMSIGDSDGEHVEWEGEPGDSILFRSTPLTKGTTPDHQSDSAADLDTFHTCVADLMAAHGITNVRDLVPHLHNLQFTAGVANNTITLSRFEILYWCGPFRVYHEGGALPAPLNAATLYTVGPDEDGIGTDWQEYAIYAGGVRVTLTDAGSGTHRIAVNVTPEMFWCPGYLSPGHALYDNAMAKFEQYVKWLLPVMVCNDQEDLTRTPAWQNEYGVSRWLYGNWPFVFRDDLSHCSRCGSMAGYEAARDAFAADIIATVRRHVPDAIVTFCNCFSTKANHIHELYSPQYWNFGDISDSGITVGAPLIYALSTVAIANGIDPADQLAIFQAGAAQHYDTSPDYLWCKNEENWWQTRPAALAGSYVWLTHATVASQLLAGNLDGEVYGVYLTDHQFYALCYALGRAGAVGFLLYPGYQGKKCPNDTALTRLIPVGIQAFADAKAFIEAAATPKRSGRPLRVRSNA